MAQEIERKFLVASQTWRELAGERQRFQQAYLLFEGDRTLRIRVIDGNEARLTVKIGSGMVRSEYEYPVPVDDGLELLDQAVGACIEKTRYRLPWKGHVWEVDVFDGALAGLVVAEVELDSADIEPDLPDWLGREVTNDAAYSNAALARNGLAVKQRT